jgi:PBP1b-binding outer membrane lipoprotein LpoB
MKRYIIFLLSIIFFMGCGNKNSNQPGQDKNSEIRNVKIDHPYELGDKMD